MCVGGGGGEEGGEGVMNSLYMALSLLVLAMRKLGLISGAVLHLANNNDNNTRG